MTLNCDLNIDEARRNFAAEQNDETAADLLESLEQYWRYDFIDDKTCAAELKRIADYLDNKPRASVEPSPLTDGFQTQLTEPRTGRRNEKARRLGRAFHCRARSGSGLGRFVRRGRFRLRYRVEIDIVILADDQLLGRLRIIDHEFCRTGRRRFGERDIFRQAWIIRATKERLARAIARMHHIFELHFATDCHRHLPCV